MSPEEQITAILNVALSEAGAAVVDGIRQEISRAYPPSSEPGTPPHLRTGDLGLGIRFSVDEFWSGVGLTIISDAPYSIYLRDGTGRMAARDYFGQTMAERYAPLVTDILQKHFGFQSTPLDRLADLLGIEFDSAASAA